MTDSFIPSRRNFLTATAATGAAAVATTARAASFDDHPDAVPMIRCVRLWTGDDGDSHFEEGTINLSNGARGDLLSEVVAVTSLSFQETTSGGSFEWHRDPVPRFVFTLSGTLEFETRGGERFTIHPGDVMLAEDNSGSGHRWKLIGDEPWRRAYVVFPASATLPFKAHSL
jgi:quercetin dioxygenase-like cupin family protein